MKKFNLLILIFIISCSSPFSNIQKQESASPHYYDEILSQWDANIDFFNFTEVEKVKVYRAVEIIKKTIRSKEFKDLVLHYHFNDTHSFNENKGYSNQEVFQLILLGAEIVGNKIANSTMDVELELYEDTSKTIGYTYPHTTRIWMNRKYFHKYTPNQVAGNLMHEWMHKLGFTHEFKWNKDREHTVPYAIGYLIEDISIKLGL